MGLWEAMDEHDRGRVLPPTDPREDPHLADINRRGFESWEEIGMFHRRVLAKSR
jgi:hypothetical protein